MDKANWYGTWRLKACELRSTRGVTTYPYGRNPSGYIMYLEPDRMAVAISGEKRHVFAKDDLLGGTDQEKSEAFESYVSYCGTFEVGEKSVIHRIDVSLFPNWVGTSQERLYRFDGDLLYLNTTPVELKGEQQTAHLIWQKV